MNFSCELGYHDLRAQLEFTPFLKNLDVEKFVLIDHNVLAPEKCCVEVRNFIIFAVGKQWKLGKKGKVSCCVALSVKGPETGMHVGGRRIRGRSRIRG